MRTTIAASLLLFLSIPAHALPKYGPNAVPLSKQSNRAYFQKNPAPDFWSLIGYYVPQDSGQRCSAANFSMVLNAARAGQALNSDQQLVTIESLLEKYTDERYKNAMTKGLSLEKFDRSNVANARLVEVFKIAVEKLGLSGPKTQIELVPVDAKNLAASKKRFHEDLDRNEKSAADFMILTAFVQGKLTGDPEGGAHVATVGAYDAKKRLVLILDPDREWYEPYWAPEDAVFEAVADPKADHAQTGWLYARLH